MGAFKMRGACNMLAQLPPEARAAGVITYSSGNHGQAVALAAQRLGLPCVVVMPETAPRVKVDGVRRYGGEVIFAGTTSLDRKTRAEAEAAARGLTIVPPFDHPWIIAGAGTCGLEILEQCPDVTRRLRADRRRRTALRHLDGDQGAAARRPRDRRRTRGRREDDGVARGRSSGHASRRPRASPTAC